MQKAIRGTSSVIEKKYIVNQFQNHGTHRLDLVSGDDQAAFEARVIVRHDNLQAGILWAIGG